MTKLDILLEKFIKVSTIDYDVHGYTGVHGGKLTPEMVKYEIEEYFKELYNE